MIGRVARMLGVGVLAAALLAPAGTARASDPLLAERNPLISRAIEEFEDGNYDEVTKLLNRALTETHPTNEQKLKIYLYLGRGQARRGNESEARKAFGRLLVLNPEAVLPVDADEDEKYAFERAQAQRAEEDARVNASEVEIQHTPPGAVIAGQAAELVVEGVGLPEGTTIMLYHTRSMDSPYSSSLMDNPDRGKWTAKIPTMTISDTTKEYEIFYYIEVTDAADDVLASAGEEARPLSFRVVAPKVVDESPPVWKEWWFWTAIGGGAAVALGLGLGLGLGLQDDVTTGSADVTISIAP